MKSHTTQVPETVHLVQQAPNGQIVHHSLTGSRSLGPRAAGDGAPLEERSQEPLDAHRTESSGGHDFGKIRVNADGSDRIDPKLLISQPGDPGEREANRVARHIVLDVLEGDGHSETPVAVGRQPSGTASDDLDESLRSVLHSIAAGSGQDGDRLPGGWNRKVAPRFRHDFSAVRVHTGPKAAAMNRALQARAFTLGNDIFFGSGQFQPETIEGDRLIAHELTHVVQQAASGGAADSGSPPSMLVQRDHHHSRYPEPRLAELSVRRDPTNRHTLIFSERVTVERAVRHIWPSGYRPPVEVFYPDQNDPWANRAEARFERFTFNWGHPLARPGRRAMWANMRQSVRQQFGASVYREQERLGAPQRALFPAWVPETVRTHILATQSMGRTGTRAQVFSGSHVIVWTRVSPERDINYFIQPLLPTDMRTMLRVMRGDRQQARLFQQVCRGWNRRMIQYVVAEGMHPDAARQRIRAEDRHRLVMELLNAIAQVIPERIPAFLTSQSSRLARLFRREGEVIAEGAETAVSDAGHAPTLPPERAPTIPAERAPTVPAERAPTIPAERAPTVPAERAPTVPEELASTIPPEHSPTIPAEAPAGTPRRSGRRLTEPQPVEGGAAPHEDVSAGDRQAIVPPEPVNPITVEQAGAQRAAGQRIANELPPGGSVSPLTAAQREAAFRHMGGTNMRNPTNYSEYLLDWQAYGQTGTPPPHGFVVRDADGTPVNIIAFWEHGIGQTRPHARRAAEALGSPRTVRSQRPTSPGGWHAPGSTPARSGTQPGGWHAPAQRPGRTDTLPGGWHAPEQGRPSAGSEQGAGQRLSAPSAGSTDRQELHGRVLNAVVNQVLDRLRDEPEEEDQ